MCGIGSISFSSRIDASKFDLEKGVSELLSELDGRGRDACGMMYQNGEGTLLTQKAALRAYGFNRGRIAMPSDTRAVAVHTRFATQGDKGWMRNNHPVMAGDAFVIHNGVVDDSEVERVQGHPEVDTYALAVASYPIKERLANESAKQHALRLASAQAQIEGAAATITMFQGVPMLVAARLTQSPLHFVNHKGVLITASTVKAIVKCAEGLGFDLPTHFVEVEKTKQGKKEMVREEYYSTQEAEEGDVLYWTGTSHGKGEISMPERKVRPKSWRKYFTTGETGNEPPKNNYQYSSGQGYQGTPYQGWGAVMSTTERVEKHTDGSDVKVRTVRYANGTQFISKHRVVGGAFISSQTIPPASADKDATCGVQTTDDSIAERPEYPAGTPWPPTSQEGEEFARHFLLWRRSSHGMKWARMHPEKAKAYDEAHARRQRNKLTPPFPAPVEVQAMIADPLYTRTASADGTITGHDLAKAASELLLGAGYHDEEDTCEVCGQPHNGHRKQTPDGEMCEECERLWMWSEYQAR